MSATLTTARVKFQSRRVNTKHGERINAVVTLPEGDVTLWGKVGDASLEGLRKGQQVQLVKDSKGYKLLAQSPANSQASQQGLTTDQKRAIASYVTEQAKLFKFCWETVEREMEGVEVTREDLRAIATTLHIAAQKKFNF